MKITLTLEGVHPYDGDYDVDLEQFTNRDFHDIKRLTGCTPPELADALERGDTDFVVALSVIALRKSGRFAKINEDTLWDAVSSRFDINPVEVEKSGDADPPTTLNAPETLTTRSGGHSPTDGDSQAEKIQRPIGMVSSAS